MFQQRRTPREASSLFVDGFYSELALGRAIEISGEVGGGEGRGEGKAVLKALLNTCNDTACHD